MKNLNNPITNIALAILAVVLLLGVGVYTLYSANNDMLSLTGGSEVESVATTTASASPETVTQTIPVPVVESAPVTKLAILTGSILPDAESGDPYTVVIRTTGGSGALGYTWSVNDGEMVFPVPGLTLSSTKGKSISIVGTPPELFIGRTKVAVPATFTLRLTVTSGAQSATQSFKLRIVPATSTPAVPAGN